MLLSNETGNDTFDHTENPSHEVERQNYAHIHDFESDPMTWFVDDYTNPLH